MDSLTWLLRENVPAWNKSSHPLTWFAKFSLLPYGLERLTSSHDAVVGVGNVPIIKGWMVPNGLRSLVMMPAICQWDIWAQKVSQIHCCFGLAIQTQEHSVSKNTSFQRTTVTDFLKEYCGGRMTIAKLWILMFCDSSLSFDLSKELNNP